MKVGNKAPLYPRCSSHTGGCSGRRGWRGGGGAVAAATAE